VQGCPAFERTETDPVTGENFLQTKVCLDLRVVPAELRAQQPESD
jgi:hypothetical protein